MTTTLYFYSNLTRKRVKFTNWKSLNFTRAGNKEGSINIKLDVSETSLMIQIGWDVEIVDSGSRVFYGKIQDYKRQTDTVDIKGIDLMGMLAQKNLYRRPILATEASAEVKTQLDGLIISEGITLSAQEFVKPTGSTRTWHSENNSLVKYFKEMGENIVNISGFANFYMLWIDPYFKVHWGEHGSDQSWSELPIKKTTYQATIKDTFNKITAKGNPITVIPYDKDFWTEQLDAGTWTGQSTSAGATADTTYMHADNVDSSTSVNNPSNAIGDDGSYAEIYGATGTMTLSFNETKNVNGSSQTFVSASLMVDLTTSDPYVDPANKAKVTIYINDGGGNCAGHTLTSPSDGWNTITCGHSQNFNSTDFSTNPYGGTWTVQIDNDSDVEGGFPDLPNIALINIDHVKYKINYTYDEADYSKNDFTLDNGLSNFGLRSVALDSIFSGSGAQEFKFSKRLYSQETGTTFNMENFRSVHFQYFIDSTLDSGILGASGLASVRFEIESGEGAPAYWTWNDVASDGYDNWYEYDLDKDDADATGGTDDLTIASIISLIFVVNGTGTSAGVINLDNYYFELDQFEYTADDNTSQSQNGVRDKILMAREFFSNAECQTLADIYLANNKDAKETWNITVDGFYDIYPNSTLEFVDKDIGKTFSKPINNVTVYFSVEGNKTMQITVGDYIKTDIDKIVDKFAEINRNYELLKNPYKLA